MKTPNNTELLNKIENTDSDDLGQNVAKSEGISGAVIPQYSKRRINYINVSESELSELDSLSWEVGVFFSISTFFLGLFINTLKDKILSETPTAFVYFIFVLLLIATIMIISFVLAIRSWRKKGKKIDTIKKECTSFDQT